MQSGAEFDLYLAAALRPAQKDVLYKRYQTQVKDGKRIAKEKQILDCEQCKAAVDSLQAILGPLRLTPFLLRQSRVMSKSCRPSLAYDLVFSALRLVGAEVSDQNIRTEPPGAASVQPVDLLMFVCEKPMLSHNKGGQFVAVFDLNTLEWTLPAETIVDDDDGDDDNVAGLVGADYLTWSDGYPAVRVLQEFSIARRMAYSNNCQYILGQKARVLFTSCSQRERSKPHAQPFRKWNEWVEEFLSDFAHFSTCT
jgi:hypothetical protein